MILESKEKLQALILAPFGHLIQYLWNFTGYITSILSVTQWYQNLFCMASVKRKWDHIYKQLSWLLSVVNAQEMLTVVVIVDISSLYYSFLTCTMWIAKRYLWSLNDINIVCGKVYGELYKTKIKWKYCPSDFHENPQRK